MQLADWRQKKQLSRGFRKTHIVYMQDVAHRTLPCGLWAVRPRALANVFRFITNPYTDIQISELNPKVGSTAGPNGAGVLVGQAVVAATALREG